MNTMEALAYIEPNDAYEIIEGVKYMSAATAVLNHGTIVNNLSRIFSNYIFERGNGGVFLDNTDVHLPDGNLFRPDMSVVCDLSIADRYGNINGAPDLCVEVLSPSTVKNDRGRKKNIYARNGVIEYWIVDPKNKSVEVYYLTDGRYELDELYQLYSTKEWNALTAEEKSSAKFEIKVSLFDDLLVDIREVFRWWGEPLPVYSR